ncbi:DUF3035 domain-containing protein [Halovulum marinum]|nr:DUF3035 domain-containing protein [Halovulum marinum]
MAQALRIILAAGAAAILAGCGGGDSDERSAVERLTAGSRIAPEEFAVLPQKPLQLPEDLTALPPPLPGTVSRTDLTPNADAVAALSGTPQRGAVVASDNALLAAAATGASANIRQVVAAEDLEYRRNNQPRLLYRLFGTATETSIYDGQALNPDLEQRRLRALGVQVPAAPPRN